MGNLWHLRDWIWNKIEISKFSQHSKAQISRRPNNLVTTLLAKRFQILFLREILSLLVDLGYTINITKSVLYPTTSVEYLGLTVDSLKQAFIVPGRKIEALVVLIKNILGCKNWHKSESPAGISGKCISLSLGAPAAKQFIREISHATASANNNGRVSLTPALREELSYWQFLDPWQGCLPWRDEKHVRLSFSTDASGFG